MPEYITKKSQAELKNSAWFILMIKYYEVDD